MMAAESLYLYKLVMFFLVNVKFMCVIYLKVELHTRKLGHWLLRVMGRTSYSPASMLVFCIGDRVRCTRCL